MSKPKHIIKISRLGIYVPYIHEFGALLDTFKFVPPFNEALTKTNRIPPPKPVDMFRLRNINDKNYCIFPVFLLDDIKRALQVARLDQMYDFDVKDAIKHVGLVNAPKNYDKFYDYQYEIVDKLLDTHYSEARVAQHTASIVLNMPTGAGKTYISILFTIRLKARTLYVCHRSAIQEQTVAAYRDYGLKVSDRGDDIDNMDVDVVVLVINTLMGLDAKRCAEFGFIVFDEVHRFVSPGFNEVMWLTRARYNLCMSATTDERDDGLDIMYHIHHGPTVMGEELGIKSKIYHFNVNVFIAPRRWPGEYLETEKTSNDLRSYWRGLDALSKCRERELLCIDLLRSALEAGYCIYIMVHKVETVDKIYALIQQSRMNVADDDKLYTEVCMLMGKTNEKALAHKSGRIVIATYKYIIEGISIPHMTCLLMWDPPLPATFKQCVGRILRPGPQQTQPRLIIDLVDLGSMFMGWFKKRTILYEARNYTTQRI